MVAEILGLAVSTVSIAESLLKAIRGVRMLYHATDDAPQVLDRLEKDATTIKVYLHFVDEAITRTKFPDSFIAWLDNEKELIGHATSRIEEYAKTVEKRLGSSRLISGVQYALDVTEISKVQEQLVSSISTIGHMMAICRHDSIDSRAAALRDEKSERLRAQTESTIAECREESLGSCNACISLDESGGASSEDPQPYQEVLKRSKPYMRAATRSFFSIGDIGAGSPGLEFNEEDRTQQPLDPGIQDPNSRLSPAPVSHSQSPRPGNLTDNAPESHGQGSSPGLIPPTLFALSTQSSSSHHPGTSILHSWSTPDEITSLSTPLTTQTVGPVTGHHASYHRRYLPLRVEIDTLGQLTMEMDRLQTGDLYSNVTAAILTLRNRLMGSVGVIAAETAVFSKEQGIIPYKAEDEGQPGLTIRLSRGYLDGAIEDLDTGFFLRLEIFALFALPQSEDKVPLITDMISDSQRTGAGGGKARDPAHFPTVESVLNLCDPAAIKRVTQAFNAATLGSSSWSLIWISSNFMSPQSPWPDALMLGGPDWCEKQLVATGGSSDVYRVLLSGSQQPYFINPGPFALKALRPGQEHLFARELEAHMQFAATKKTHIVTLLMAYEQAGRFHFLFPWADGTLTAFFQSQAVSPSAEVIHWLLSQFVGILEALERIHCTSLVSEEDIAGASGGARFGSHGDIKPDNILWFQPLSQVDSKKDYGTLVVTDFGLTRLQRIDPDLGPMFPTGGGGGTLAYAPPDSDHSPSYDVFSLGCVLLEVAAWIAGGPEAWQRFHSARFDDGKLLSYIALRDGSLRLHPYLSNPRSIVEVLFRECRQKSDGQYPIAEDSGAFLGQWCDVVERCLDLQPENRPSASDLVDFLKSVETELRPPPSPSTPRTVMAIEKEARDEPIEGNPETRLDGRTSVENDAASLGRALVVPITGKTNNKIPPGLISSQAPSVTVGPTEASQEPWGPSLGHSCSIVAQETTSQQPRQHLDHFGDQSVIGKANPGRGRPESLPHRDSDDPRSAGSPDIFLGAECNSSHLASEMNKASPLSCQPPTLGSENQTVSPGQPFVTSYGTCDSVNRDTLTSPTESQIPTISFSNWHSDTPAAGHGQGLTTPESSPTLYSGVRRRLGFLSRSVVRTNNPCWRCRNSNSKCDGGVLTPCDRCSRRMGNLGIPCYRGPVCDVAAEIPFLCHIKQSSGPSQATILPSALQPAVDLLRDATRRRNLTTMRLKGCEHEAGSNYRIFSRVLNTNVPNIRIFNPFESVGSTGIELPYDDLIAFIVWEVEDNPETAELTGIESLEDLVDLLEAASLYEVRWGHHERARRPVYYAIQSFLGCLRALRVALHGLLEFSAHTCCSQANGCVSPAFQDLTKYSLRYADALDKALFSRRRGLEWPSVFYSLCIQQHVRRGLMSLEKRLQSAVSVEVHGSKPPPQTANYLKSAVAIFEEISRQKNKKLAKRLRDEQPRPSEYIPQPPRASRAGGVASSWRNWHEEGISKFLDRIFGASPNPDAGGTSSDQSKLASDLAVASIHPMSLALLTGTPRTPEVMGQGVNCSSFTADESLCTIPPAGRKPQPSIIESIDSRWTATTREADSDMLTFFSGHSASSSTQYARSLRSTLSDVEDEGEGEDSWIP